MNAARLAVGRHGAEQGTRALAEEAAIAFTYGRTTYAVMMATPADLADFALGFSLTEGVIAAPEELSELEIVEHPRGIELRMTLCDDRDVALMNRRRKLAGPVGCGLCGVESLEAAIAPVRHVASDLRVGRAEVFAALARLASHQVLNRETRAVHGAGYWPLGADDYRCVREDVGRHNALDKLCGALKGDASGGMVVLTSRVSIEMVQKSAAMNAAIVVAVSAPTALAIQTAEAAGITLVAVARDDGFEVFTHAERITT
ncbi:MAG: formate dehydrogenase accessory sulfurtransferase FdhD [Alphaproteobacteria bacterium]|nr:formate dehydrogenase accessory sulfurtransferase FdhD [Alphaproteobacteria bacterium]MBV9693207.1 formate dehydrogenase accessory sulfurtransferase FdhD [Alphaproteobacteria bacterium]